MHLVENQDPKVIEAFLRKQKEQCGLEGAREHFLNQMLNQ